MGKSNQLPTKAKRTRDVAAREEKKSRVKAREPHGNATGPGAHLELSEDLLKKHESSLTDFKMQVYALTQKIPAGKVTTYGAMAGPFY
jgi:O6-methylguanine-DNA--protein-cysteine methyltransferase